MTPKEFGTEFKESNYVNGNLGGLSCCTYFKNPCHFYGVITEFTNPYEVAASTIPQPQGEQREHHIGSKRFICSLKVVDPSFRLKGAYATVVLYAKKFEDLPTVHKIGDIIRVHRADMIVNQNRR